MFRFLRIRLIWLIVVARGPYLVETQTTDGGGISCLNDPLPAEYKEWPKQADFVRGDQVNISWKIDKVCFNILNCFGGRNLSGMDGLIRFNQLPPVQIRPDQFIQFKTELSSEDSEVTFEYYEVSELGFEGCDTNAGLRLDNGTVILGVANGFLSIGNNYFIANGINGSALSAFLRCSPYGLRLNVTVQTKNCNQEENDQTHLDDCNGRGRCVALPYQPNYSCRCCPGFIGPYCEKIDGCYGNTCHSGGTCQDGPDDGQPFTCSCIPGFTGRWCESMLGEMCPTNDCMNQGICFLSTTEPYYTCTCQVGFTGKVCQTNINDCDSNPCLNGGFCQDETNAYRCECLQYYSGLNCETYVGVCPEGRCFNGGTCQPLEETGGSMCLCPPLFTGTSCETKVEMCHSKLCINAIDCVDYGTSFKCVCKPGYDGEFCDLDVDECSSNPCQNGGNCTDLVAAFSCRCLEGFEQPTCQTPPKDNSLVNNKALFGLVIAASILGAILFVALVVLLVYWCTTHKPYKRLFNRRKYIHVVDEKYGPADDATVTSGAYPSPEFVADHDPPPPPLPPRASSPEGLHYSSFSGSAKSPLVRRANSKAKRV